MASARVCLTLSSFRNDESVTRLLRDNAGRTGSPFERIFVVDSLGTGAIPDLISKVGWTDVSYHDSAENLGSAGNLSTRLRLAADAGFDYAYAINHDAQVHDNVVRSLVDFAQDRARVGAVYPLRYLTQRGTYDLTGTQKAPLPTRGAVRVPAAQFLEVCWSSSNGALYALAPVRAGLTPWADLWMGWEDMGYGWLLESNGFSQFIVTAAREEDDYEYRQYRFLGRSLYLSDKPAWYAYYQVRNMLLITRRNNRPMRDYAVVAARVVQEVALTTLFRPEKRTRYRLLASGLIDGLRGRTGKWHLP